MRQIFYPKSVVVIGVSERSNNLARNIVGNLRAFKYQGQVYAVGQREGEVYDTPIVESLYQVPDDLDLAVILTPAAVVPGLVDACGQKGIRRVIIESGGFSEFSATGRGLEAQVLEAARKWDIRFVGPNCISAMNLEAGVCLPFATISPVTVRFGPASVVAQSGGVSITYLDRLSMAGVGVNKVVSIGNKTDLDEVDYLAYLLDDPGTQIVCLYLESIERGRELFELARRAGKPVIVHKANRGHASQTIAQSHTAALAADDRIVGAALAQAGAIRAESFRDAVAAAQGMALPPVKGNNLVIISRSGGHAVIAADMAEQYGFRLQPIPESFARSVQALFSADVIAPTNPLDLGTIFDFDIYAQIVAECLRELAPDAVLLINTHSVVEAEGARRLTERVERIVRESKRPVAFCAYAQGEAAQELQRDVSIPIFEEIEDALRGLAASRDWHRWQAQRAGATPHPLGSPLPEVTKLLAQPGLLTTDRALALCRAYAMSVVPGAVVSDPDAAVAAAERLGGAVALKVLSPEIAHKSDVGGVALNLSDAAAVRLKAERLLALAPGAAVLVQRMVEGGVEVILGGKRDPSFGPVVMFGLGGVMVETFADVTFRLAPIDRADAEAMVDAVRGSALLKGVRGVPPADREALVRALLTVSRMMAENPQIAELDINPLLVLEQGAVAVDARVVVG
ncbi:MAG: acetate--CoA ligase family protein [Anaerolineae bacterium]|nr:acetate--CoA ligase family protein [Anaerolineae bacterium]